MLHFLSRFAKSKKEEHKYGIVGTFCNVQVNIPLLDAIKKVPRYTKFLKEICNTKRKLKGNVVVSLGDNVLAILQRKLPFKFKDLGSFTISCIIGTTRFEIAILDLGVSINVMPYSINASLGNVPLKDTGVII